MAKQSAVSEPEAKVGSGLLSAFRKHGYEGASLADLSAETGLIKASLYHRFPEGKQQMAAAAIAAAEEGLRAMILAPLKSDRPLEQRLAEVVRQLQLYYGQGRQACLLDTLSLRGTPEAVVQRAAATARLWATAFARLARAGGMTPAAAKLAADDALVLIEGALVMCRVYGNTAPFQRAMQRLPSVLLPAHAPAK